MFRSCLVTAAVAAALFTPTAASASGDSHQGSAPAAYAGEAGPVQAGREAAAESGFRIEALAGLDNNGFEYGMLYGGRVGYDFKVGGRFLLGVDGEYSELTTDQELGLPGSPSLTAEDGPEYYVGARATFVLSSRFRLFGGAGYTHVREGFFYQIGPNPTPLGPVGVGRTSFDGLRLSAGGQVLLGRRAFLGAEYRRSGYEDFGLKRDQLVGSIGFRF